jgi:hypothetical protein
MDKNYVEAGRETHAPTDPWKHRSSGMRCSTCIWFVPKLSDASVRPVNHSIIGRCRRHAPTMGGYPVVFSTDWCGDHRLDENKV